MHQGETIFFKKTLRFFLDLSLNDVVSAIKVTYNNHGIRTSTWQTTIRQQF